MKLYHLRLTLSPEQVSFRAHGHYEAFVIAASSEPQARVCARTRAASRQCSPVFPVSDWSDKDRVSCRLIGQALDGVVEPGVVLDAYLEG